MNKIIFFMISSLFYANLVYAKIDYEAENMTFDHNNDTIVFDGNLKLTYDSITFLAEKASYNTKTKRFITFGDSWLIGNNNQKAYIKDPIDIVLENNKVIGEFNDVRAKIGINSYVTAKKLNREANEDLIFEDARYTPCGACGERTAWEIKGSKVIKSASKKSISVYNPVFYAYGVPFLWLPYFEQPDESVKRKTGILFPTIAKESHYGFSLALPVFIDINNQTNLTLTPTVYTEGYYGLDAFLETKQKYMYNSTLLKYLGHFKGKSDSWFIGVNNPIYINKKLKFDLQFANISDISYYKSFDFDGYDSEAQSLKSTVALNFSDNNNLLKFGVNYYQSLNGSDNNNTLQPTFTDYNFLGNAAKWGQVSFNGNFVTMSNSLDYSEDIISASVTYEKTFTSLYFGEVDFNIATIFNSIKESKRNKQKSEVNFSGKVSWSYPFLLSNGRNFKGILSPEVSFFGIDKSNFFVRNNSVFSWLTTRNNISWYIDNFVSSNFLNFDYNYYLKYGVNLQSNVGDVSFSFFLGQMLKFGVYDEFSGKANNFDKITGDNLIFSAGIGSSFLGFNLNSELNSSTKELEVFTGALNVRLASYGDAGVVFDYKKNNGNNINDVTMFTNLKIIKKLGLDLNILFDVNKNSDNRIKKVEAGVSWVDICYKIGLRYSTENLNSIYVKNEHKLKLEFSIFNNII